MHFCGQLAPSILDLMKTNWPSIGKQIEPAHGGPVNVYWFVHASAAVATWIAKTHKCTFVVWTVQKPHNTDMWAAVS